MAMEASMGLECFWDWMLGCAAVTQLRQMGGLGPGRMSLVRVAGLAVDVGVERSWRSHVGVFQQMAFQHSTRMTFMPFLSVVTYEP